MVVSVSKMSEAVYKHSGFEGTEKMRQIIDRLGGTAEIVAGCEMESAV
jgi:hypothetical protein